MTFYFSCLFFWIIIYYSVVVVVVFCIGPDIDPTGSHIIIPVVDCH
jgi:hypothetical protein